MGNSQTDLHTTADTVLRGDSERGIKAVRQWQVVNSGYEQKADMAGTRYHFIGAGGVGMSGLAKVLLKNRAMVTGSDQTETTVIQQLREMGADIKIGHSTANFDPATESVVISAAIREDNPELQMAGQKGCKVYKYAQMLGELMGRYDGIAISGTHGKSTTSGWLTYCMKLAGADPNFIVGADISQLGGSSGVGQSPYFIAEACEYDRSFLNLKPKISCILNIEADHLDYYKDEDDIVDAFVQFALGTETDGILIANGQDPNVAKLLERLPANRRFETFGLDGDCDYSAQNIILTDGLYSFDVYHQGSPIARTRISLPGRHNILNALAVIAIAANAGLDPARMVELLSCFTGIDRRLMFKDTIDQIIIMDDYAHHPTEIRASLEAIKQRYQPERLWCVFQPHQYSRTRFLLDDFAESFKLADTTIVPQIYFVRDTQQGREQVNAEKLVEKISGSGANAKLIDGFEPICDYLERNVKRGDLVVTMGAGDIWKVADEYIQRLRRNC